MQSSTFVFSDTDLIIGVDEVGRGCWAGPLVVGLVILNDNIPGLADSKALSSVVRRRLAVEIKATARVAELGWVEPAEIDELGLTAATTLAIERALEKCGPIAYDHIVIDGSVNFLPGNPKTIIIPKADSLVPAVSAASILAKVARDDFMAQQAEIYQAYGFEKHVGYGTKLHRDALQLHGLTPLHRQSFRPIQAVLASSLS